MINGIKLGDQNLSPNQRRLRLKELSGQILTESEKKKLKPRKSLLNESVVSMVELPKNSDRMSPTQSLKNTFGSKKSIEDYDEDEDIDLEEILREMGYYEEDESDVKVPIGDDEDIELDIEDYDEDELREYIRNQIQGFRKELENLDYEVGPIGDELELDEIVMDIDSDEDDLDENITYDVDYISYNGGKKKCHRITRTFNNDNHFSNWYKWMNKQGLKILGVHDQK